MKKLPIKLNKPPLFEVNFGYQKVVSYSQFSMWSQCPHKWYLTAVEKKDDGPPNIQMIFGSAIHFVLQTYIGEMYKISGAAADKLDLDEIFEEKYISEYQLNYDRNNKQHFSTPTEMRDFREDGYAIVNWFKKHRQQYFSVRGNHLVGVEMPLVKEVAKNVFFSGFIDLVLYNENTDKIQIFDFKTSLNGWNKWKKKDEKVLSQIILYKKYFSEVYNWPVDKIDVEFIILKRKPQATEYTDHPKFIQSVIPAAGKIKLNEVATNFGKFLNECFDSDGKPIRKEYTKNFTKLCEWCIFNNTDNCTKEDQILDISDRT